MRAKFICRQGKWSRVPRVSDLLTGKITKFSLDALVNMLAPVGLMFEVRPIEPPPGRAVLAS